MRLASLGIGILLLALLLAPVAPCHAQEDCLYYKDYFHWAGGTVAPEGAQHIAMDQGIAAVARGDDLQYCDVSNPFAPVFRDTLELEDDIEDLDLIETIAFVANGSGGLLLVDMRNPDEMVALDSLDVGSSVTSVAATTHPVFVVDNWGEFYIVDCSNVHNLELISNLHLPCGYSYDVAAGVHERYAYVAGYDSLFVVDCDDVGHPVLAASVYTGSSVDLVCVASEDRAYIGGYGEDDYVLIALDISDPTAPAVGTELPLPSECTAIHGRGNLAYVSCDYDGLLIVDVPDPRFPELLHTADVYHPMGICANDHHVIACCDGNWCLEVFAQMDQPEAEPLATLTERQPTDVTVYQRYATVLDDTDSLFIYDCIDPAAPTLMGAEALPTSSSWHMASDGHYAFYTTTNGGFHTVRLEDPTDPEYLGGVDTPGWSPHVDLCTHVGPYAAVADGNGGLHIIDFHDLENPAIAYTEPLLACNGLDVSGDRLCAGDWTWLRIFDISNPLAPVELGSTDPIDEEISCVAVSGDHAFVTDYNGRFYVADISTPTAPQWVAYLNVLQSSGYDILVEGDYAYLANDFQGVFVINVTNPEDPRAIGYLSGSNVVGLGVSDEHLYIADRDIGFGLGIAPLQCPANTAVPDGELAPSLHLVRCRPNPFGARATFSYSLPVSGPVRLEIVDVTGRLVTTLAGGDQEVTWDGTAAGRPVRPGIYFARLDTARNESACCRVTVVR